MKLAVILAVAMVMMMGQDVQSWRVRVRRVVRVVRTVVTPTRWGSEVGRIILGKRSGEAEFNAAFEAATADNVLTADEISELLGLEGQELIAFIAEADINGDGQIDLEEFIAKADD
ncbi:hypothetical protein LOTGIDRAFT_228793 [Lottia gigantea]|uniref:EF-hand domain-containing protein n=1 Tax=Lottia gigantea TaxID=225164 RepID=V4A3T6_LOTGI|nr:hypothetical protein LOTGIDRAFT_228793 [Lottia gigantea]ESO91332.1 hypothetical protein LOTGIDRAFT_228793 [Lottia gigantea]